MKDSIHPIYFEVENVSELLAVLARQGKSYSSVFVLADSGIPETVRSLFVGDIAHNHVLVLQGGESVKTLPSIEKIWNFLLGVKADRNSLLINLGGGALCDAGGFAASTFKRGIDFVHVPSTLLSMVDASVGGKTGINVGSVKNTVGTFTMPTAVFIRRQLLDSLSKRQLLSGYAEMIKHGLISDVNHLDNVLSQFSEGNIPSIELIQESIEIKSSIVGRDPLEKGERKLLNFGHTIGHGIESFLNEKDENAVLHGEAIAAGMLAEMYISGEMCNYPEGEIIRFKEWLKPLTKHIRLNEEMIPGILSKIANDKKNEGDEIGITLLQVNGKGVWGKTVSNQLIEKSLEYLINLL